MESPRLLRTAFVVVAAVSGAIWGLACEEGGTRAETPPPSLASMPRAPDPAPSASANGETAASSQPAAMDAPPPLDLGDAGPQLDDSPHAILVSACAVDRRGCYRAQPGAPADSATYRVAFGHNPGTVRSRTQAMAALYKELHDRLQLNQHLIASARRLGDQVSRREETNGAHPHGQAADDPTVDAAFQLMEEVDREGAVTVDTVPGLGAYACRISLSASILGGDAGSGRCLVEAPPRPEARPGFGH